MSYQAYLFDFDYTLADSSRGIVMCFRNVLEQHGYADVTDDAICRTIGKTLEESFSILTGITDADRLADFKQQYRQEADIHMTRNTHLFPETLRVLRALKRRGARVGIISTKYRFRIHELLDQYLPADFLDIVVGGEDVSRAKPDPEGLLFAIGRLGIKKKHILYIGDSTVDAETAQAAGVDFAGVTHGVTTADELRRYPHRRIMATLDELLAPPTIVKFLGTPKSVQLHVFGTDPRVTLILEDGSEFTGEFGELAFQAESDDVNVYTLSLNDDIPAGYHTLTFTDSKRTISCALLCAPARIPVPQAVQDQQRWGWMAQMYSVRSAGSWGVGDYGDLRMLASDAAAKSGADFMLINPIHASAPITPLEPSPYLPESRRFLNVTYIRPQDIPEFEELGERDLATVRDLHDRVAVNNTNPDPIDINAAWDAKRTALEIIFRQKRSAEREAAFAEFRRAAGDDLRAFALWCVAFEVWGAPWEEGVDWFSTTNRDSPEIAQLEQDHADLYEFACWLQWIADEQVTAAQNAARDCNMEESPPTCVGMDRWTVSPAVQFRGKPHTRGDGPNQQQY